jgi:uncharacterized OsmC-like protein
VSEERTFSLSLERREGYQFDITFDDPTWDVLRTDEPVPVGTGTAPNPTRLLGAAMGNCLAASLMFCLEKARVPVTDLRARVTVAVGRSDRGRLRIRSMRVALEPTVEGVPPERLDRCIEIFKDFCIVTQSIREGFDVEVAVEPQGTVSDTPTDAMEPVGT